MTVLSVFANSYAADGALTGWTDPANAYADDGAYATYTGAVKNVSGGNLFGFDLSALPDTATINSVTVSAEWHNSAADSAGPVLVLGVKSGGASPGNTTDTTGQTTDEIVTYSPTGLTAAQLKATGDLGFWAIVRYRRTDNTGHTAYVDCVKVTVDYTAGGLSEIIGAADITLDAIGQSIIGTVDVTGTGAVMLEGIGASITGTAQQQGAITGIIDAPLSGLTASATGTVGISGGATSTLDNIGMTATGGVEIAVVSSNTLSSLASASTGLVGVTGNASATLGGVTGEIIGVVGNAPVVGLLDATFSGVTIQAVGAVAISAATLMTLQGIGIDARVTLGQVFDVFSLQAGSKRIVRAVRPKPSRAAIKRAARHKRQESFTVEGD